MQIEFQKKAATLLVKLNGEIDHHSAGEVRERIEREFQKSGCKNIIFDFEQVGFMDSSGIGMMIGRYKWVLASGGKTAVANTTERVGKIFQMAGLYRIIPYYQTVAEALEAMGEV